MNLKRSVRRFLIPIASIYLISISPAFAAKWYSLDGAKGMEVQIDLNSIVPAGDGLIKAWITHSFDERRASKEYPVFYYQSAVQLEIYDCNQRTADTLQEVFYSDALRSGEVVKTNAYSRKNLKMTDVVPGTIGEGSLEFACAWINSKSGKSTRAHSGSSKK